MSIEASRFALLSVFDSETDIKIIFKMLYLKMNFFVAVYLRFVHCIHSSPKNKFRIFSGDARYFVERRVFDLCYFFCYF